MIEYVKPCDRLVRCKSVQHTIRSIRDKRIGLEDLVGILAQIECAAVFNKKNERIVLFASRHFFSGFFLCL